jgi:hypothetical protein
MNRVTQQLSYEEFQYTQRTYQENNTALTVKLSYRELVNNSTVDTNLSYEYSALC